MSEGGVHPLEPLSEDEIHQTVQVLREAGHTGEHHRFAAVTLAEPPKADVLGWVPGNGTDRRAVAYVVDRSTGKSATGVVSLTKSEVVSWDAADGHHMLLFEELFDAIGIVKADAGWQEALRRRGVEDFDGVQCDPWPAGNFDDPWAGKRVVRVVSYVRHDEHDNGYAHPIEGVVATVDTVERKVIDLVDVGNVPVPADCRNYHAGSVASFRDDLKTLDITQPDGPSFVVEGNEIRWQKWRFRVSMHPTDGLTLHTLTYRDGPKGEGEERSVLYRAALGEMVVPYGSTSAQHRWKNAFDSGELGLGRYPLLNSLELGCDCLGVIHYFDSPQVTDAGDTQLVKNAICLHEEDFSILWKHFDLETFVPEVRRSRRLVVSSIHTVGNYEYGFYWYLYQDGTIEMEVKLTGILQTQGVDGAAADPNAAVVSPGVAAPNHQHLFCFRLDLDVDGGPNTVYEMEAEPDPPGADNPYGNAFRSKATLLARESEARRDVDPFRGRHWRVVNPSRANRVGQPVSYRLLPGNSPLLLASPGSRIAERAAFARHNLWVTPFTEGETRAAGLPNLNPGGSGLPSFTAADRSIEDEDVVLWYTCGLIHVPRPEDFPVMPVERVGFLLQPHGFFDENPALDVPAPPHAEGHCHTTD
ncbi:MAG: primary-amine oxidase [Actinobacteria bacterium]|nr:primary-amine oxidase [Actinomycetota bacterium]